ncbi:MAG TPA: hypothetical protein VM032_00700 [Vicinamibacterales bacterium]|nr:hypothetical protein [Vicinamibacterales bacterium]
MIGRAFRPQISFGTPLAELNRQCPGVVPLATHIWRKTVKTIANGEVGGTSSWQARLGVIGALGLALATAACSGGAATATSPSGVSPSSLAAAGGAVKSFSVVVSPSTVSANGTATLHVTVTNAATSTQDLGSVQVYVDPAFSVTAVGNFVQANGNTWGAASQTSSTVEVGAIDNPAGGQQSGAGNQKLEPGQVLTFDITVTAPSVCQVYTFVQSQGSNETLAGTFDGAAWTNTAAAPAITVNNCVIECPAAQAVANAYLDTFGVSGAERSFVVTAIGDVTIGATFQGFAKCDSGFGPAVRAFVDVKRREWASL